MRVNIFSSLAAKLFGLMSFMTALVVGAMAITNLQDVKETLTESAEQAAYMIVDAANQQISGQINNWTSFLAASVASIKVVDDKVDPAQLNRLLDSNKSDYAAIQIFMVKSSAPEEVKPVASAFTLGRGSDVDLDGKSVTEIQEKIATNTKNWLTDLKRKTKTGSVQLASLAKATGLGLANIAVFVKLPNSSDQIVAVLTPWQTKIVEALENGKQHNYAAKVVDKNGTVFASSHTPEMLNGNSISKSGILIAARNKLSSGDGVEFEKPVLKREYYYNGKTMFGAFSIVPNSNGLIIIAERDHNSAFARLKQTQIAAGLWAALFILLTVFLSYVGSSQITKGLVQVTRATNRIAAGDFAFRLKPGSADEVGVLGHAVNTMSEKIVTLMQNQVEKVRFEQELETARMVQSTFFPKHDIDTGIVRLAGHYQPATECGGDLWGHFTIRPGLELVYIADAMGHGAPAALVTAMAYSTCMTISDLIKDNPELSSSPAKLLDRMNRIILEAVGGSISMTCFAILIDTNAGKLTYSNAGHNFPILVPQNPEDPRAKRKKGATGLASISLQLRGVPLGIDTAAEFSEKTMDLAPGDKIFLFTDGLIECSSEDGTVWGRKQLIEELTEAIGSTPEAGAGEIRTKIVSRAFGFFGKQPLADDVTILVAEIDRNWKVQQNPVDVIVESQEPTPNVEIPDLFGNSSVDPVFASVTSLDSFSEVEAPKVPDSAEASSKDSGNTPAEPATKKKFKISFPA